jgi:group II intron reverse transcriptase/maturase
VQMALKYILEPIFEADFYPTSYGFRRGRNTHDALAAVVRQLHPTNHGPSPVTFILEGDIKGCFDAIDIHRLMDRVRQRIGDRKVLRLVRAFLKAGVMIDGRVRHPATGTPQGGVISPLLANIYLTSLDERYERWTPRPGEPPTNAVSRRYRDRKRGNATFYMVRYADDFVLLATGTRADVEAERDALAQFLGEELRLELSKEKTLITNPQDGFVFLGYRVVQAKSYRKARLVGNLRIPKEKLSDLRWEIKQRTARGTIGRSLKELIWALNPLIRWWRTYYQYATGAEAAPSDVHSAARRRGPFGFSRWGRGKRFGEGASYAVSSRSPQSPKELHPFFFRRQARRACVNQHHQQPTQSPSRPESPREDRQNPRISAAFQAIRTAYWSCLR